MPPRHYLACLWPGLPQLWYCGVWQGLIPALSFACFFNTLLVARLIYPEWLSPIGVRIGCWLFVAVWIGCGLRSAHALPRLLAPRSVSEVADRFADAQRSFLAGAWFDSEEALKECLSVDSRDAPALLQLAAVYRITERHRQAEETLNHLQTLETAAVWWMEIESEKKRLKAASAEAAGPRVEAGESEADPAEQEISAANHDPITSGAAATSEEASA